MAIASNNTHIYDIYYMLNIYELNSVMGSHEIVNTRRDLYKKRNVGGAASFEQ